MRRQEDIRSPVAILFTELLNFRLALRILSNLAKGMESTSQTDLYIIKWANADYQHR